MGIIEYIEKHAIIFIGNLIVFYEKYHFTCIRQQEDGSKEYEIDLASVDYQIKDIYQITIK